MTILNTTFFAEASLADELAAWLRDVYMPAISGSGHFDSVETARVLEPVEPGAVSMTCRCTCPDTATARNWHDNEAAQLRQQLGDRWGQRVVWFTTYMESI